jgi:hypothetical protein
MRDLRQQRRLLRSFINRIAEERNKFRNFPVQPGAESAEFAEQKKIRLDFYGHCIRTAQGLLDFVDYLLGSNKAESATFMDAIESACECHGRHGTWLTRYRNASDDLTEDDLNWSCDLPDSFNALANEFGIKPTTPEGAIQMMPVVNRVPDQVVHTARQQQYLNRRAATDILNAIFGGGQLVVIGG